MDCLLARDRGTPMATCASDSVGTAALSAAGRDNIVIHEDQLVGHGSYGTVCKAEYFQMPCAAKMIHRHLVQDDVVLAPGERFREHRTPFARFQQECELLRELSHTNIVQYLCTYQDPSTQRPFLLMELMDDNLTSYLTRLLRQECTPPYHVQVNICHDITLALVYLHAKKIVHRDLSGKNVLLSGIPSAIKAKVTDFGMVQLADKFNWSGHSASASLTTCPGTDVYMPPEAVSSQPSYTEKIDCFSFGVIIIQILTRKFPRPDDRYVEVEGTLMRRVPEIHRRQNHISLIPRDHPLLPIALDCLDDDPTKRPSARQLCDRVAEIKSECRESDAAQRAPVAHLNDSERTHKEETREIDRDSACVLTGPSKDDAECTEIGINKEEIRKDNTCALPGPSERTDVAETDKEEIHEDSACALPGPFKEVQESFSEKTEMKLNWVKGENTPCELFQWCDAVRSGNIIYFRQGGRGHPCINYCYDTTSRQWSWLPICPLKCPTLVVADGKLIAIGDRTPMSNKVYALHEAPEKHWAISEYSPMPTKRYLTAAFCAQASLVVIGGEGEEKQTLSTVEVLDMTTKQWSAAANLPMPLMRCSVTVCGDKVYLLSGMTLDYQRTTAVHTCSMRELIESCHSRLRTSSGQSTVWNRIADLPVVDSVAVTVCGKLLAIGGAESSGDKAVSSAVHLYTPSSNTWNVVSHMTVARFQCFAALLPNGELMVVGGGVSAYPNFRSCKDVEFATLTFS